MKQFHSRSKHNDNYDFDKLIQSEPSLKQYVSLNKYDNLSIDFANPKAVLSLNKALLSYFYDIQDWEIPQGHLCPPIPSRVDYIHYIADLLAKSYNGKVPKGKNIVVLDIGVGANCIYPLIGNSIYGWQFKGSDISEIAIESINNIISSNQNLNSDIEVVLQPNKNDIFNNIINSTDKFTFSMCNPPFHKSKKDALQSSSRKVKNLTKNKNQKTTLNFGGQSNELWCDGGELTFIQKMIKQSVSFKNNCFWFTTLVSKKENLENIYKSLKKVKPFEVETIEMIQGNKISRIVAWTFLNKKEQEIWTQI